MKKPLHLFKPFVIGRTAALKMCAVEGIYMSSDTKKMFARFAEEKLSPADQRAQIMLAQKSKP